MKAMKLIGTVLRCSARKVNSSSKETYVTNLLVLDPENSGGTNYAVEVWDDKPHQVTPMSEIALTVIGVVNKSGGVPALRSIMAAQPPKPAGAEAPAAGTVAAALAVTAAGGEKGKRRIFAEIYGSMRPGRG